MRARGYTLVEVLVVLAILGVVVALVRVNFAPNPRQALDEQARRLALLFELARDEAIVRSCTIAWTKSGDAHQLACAGSGTSGGADDFQALRSWPSSIEISRFVVAGSRAAPQSPLYFTPSGINPPFEMTLALGDHRVTLAADAFGRVAVLAQGADPSQ